jgi:glycosyltransferase involved in cell wall biosynthesis
MNLTAPPLVSVVIPTYNHAHFLNHALQSVLDQSYTHWEAIVIDNNSRDNTDEVMQRFTDQRITYLKIHNNGVIAASRNAGIRAAKGKWIAFLDSDDWWVPTKLECCVAALNAGADLVYHDLYTVRLSDQVRFEDRIASTGPQHPMFVALLCTGMSIPNSSVVVRKDLLNRIGGILEDRGLISVEDYDTWIRLSRLTENFVRIPECLGYYWAGGGNISAASSKQIYIIRTLYAQYLDELPAEHRRRAEGFLAYRVGRLAQLYGDFALAADNLKIALRQPIGLLYRAKAVIFLALSFLSRIRS